MFFFFFVSFYSLIFLLRFSFSCKENDLFRSDPKKMLELKPAMTFDEVSMERSKNFVKALQELKNLRPQLYSAAEYCEKSYLHNEQKQMVLDNLKDYAVRALVNAIDHLGTVASKLNDLFEQQTFDVSTVDLKISCLNQQVLTCEAYTDKEGLRQQQLSSLIPEYHKHYILPNSINKNQLSVMKETDMKQKHIQVKPRPHPSGTPMSKTLSWHLASETKSSLDGAPVGSNGIVELKASGTTSEVFHLLDAEKAALSMSARQLLSSNGKPFVTKKNPSEANKALSQFRSFDQHGRREISHPPARSKSLLSSFFVKHKSAKLKMRQVS